jgi:hypothetical protein
MAKRTRPVIPVTWYLKEWMDTLGVNQSYMVREAGWSKTTASLLYNCQQDMNVDLLKSAATALKREPYELLMPPEDAFQIIRHRQEIQREALRLVSDRKADFAGKPDDFDLPAFGTSEGGKG